MVEAQGPQASYDFCHNPHAGALLQGLQELRSDNLLTDVVLCVSGKEILCHRNVLAASSEYFLAMFCNGHRESREHKVTIHEFSPGALQALVDYAYTSKVTITEDNAVKLLKGANFFRILPVRDACVAFISDNLSAEDCLQMLQLGNMLSCPTLEKTARAYAIKEFAAASETPEFLSLTKDQLITLISSDDLNASEEVVYTAVMAWINHDTDERNQDMKELMELVRFPFMDKQYFFENVETNEAVRKSCHGLMAEARRSQHFPGEVQSPRTRPRRASGLREAVVIVGGIQDDDDDDEESTYRSKSITMTCDAQPTSSSWIDMTELLQGSEGPFSVAVLGRSDIVVSLTTPGKDVMLYQPELDCWSKLAQMNLQRYSHGLAVLYGKVYAIGGTSRNDAALASVEVYDRSQNKWTEGVPLPQPRHCHAVAVLDTSIYVMGGFDKEFKAKATVYRFSPGDLQWQSMGDMPSVDDDRIGSWTATVLNGNIYLAGVTLQSSLYCYTPSEDGGLWSEVATGLLSGSDCGMTAFRGKVYILGGSDDDWTANPESAAVTCFDPDSQSLSRVGTMAKCMYNISCITILKYC
ncbi:kelch-like protein 24 [Branchiostoma floridae]|uniref:Kelch-like protein 24 n=1 Tax=Branchiostoma floridae TaxID=7739 RepID=A0A9J7LPR0_BRAFL|nr:kelch-like protein 24 [Branchiostoma floridae]